MKARKPTPCPSYCLIAVVTMSLVTPALADQVIQDDLVVRGSACVGLDCVNGEIFSFDTIRIKENNLRIKFDDTSTSASFPRNDWQLTANESANGGANKFSIEDITAGRTPFTIEAGARSNALYVESDGDIGIGTNNPVADVHVQTGNTPTYRMEQDGSSGFTPQTWDVASNEANFFIRDSTNGSRLPFRIRPGAPSSAIDIAADGDIGIGTSSPGSTTLGGDASLHVRRSDGNASILVEEVSGSDADRTLLELKNNGGTQVFFSDTSADGEDWQVSALGGGFIISELGTGGPEFLITDSGDLRFGAGSATVFEIDGTTGQVAVNGSVVHASSQANKEGFEPVDTGEILVQLAGLPISTWSFKFDNGAVRHIGPVAEDFQRIFGFKGHNSDQISLIDVNGITLAAIQELHKKLEILETERDELRTGFQHIQNRLEVVESMQSTAGRP